MKKIKFWWKFRHPHFIYLFDMATGKESQYGIPLTAFKWKCRFCNKEFIDICGYGWEQLEKYKGSEAFQWGRHSN